MSYENRMELYSKIEELRGKPLIVYITSYRRNAGGQMGSDVIPFFAKQINKIPKEKTEIDLLVISKGGDPNVSWRIICMLRERFSKISVLLPFEAYSAATLLALGADEIVMHPFSNLGPVDPQIVTIRQKEGSQQGNIEKFHFGAEDLSHYLDFLRSDVGITDQEQLERAFELISKDIGALKVGVAKRSTYLALSLGKKLLSLHMKDQNQVKAITEALNKSFYHHGYPVGRKEAKEIGLPINYPQEELETLLWEIWEDIEEEMDCNQPFQPIREIVKSNTNNALFSEIPQLNLPPNASSQIMQTVIKQLLKQSIKYNQPVDYKIFHATLESLRAKYDYISEGKILSIRMPDMKIHTSFVTISEGWTQYIANNSE